jgi:hypothetical protein
LYIKPRRIVVTCEQRRQIWLCLLARALSVGIDSASHITARWGQPTTLVLSASSPLVLGIKLFRAYMAMHQMLGRATLVCIYIDLENAKNRWRTIGCHSL